MPPIRRCRDVHRRDVSCAVDGLPAPSQLPGPRRSPKARARPTLSERLRALARRRTGREFAPGPVPEPARRGPQLARAVAPAQTAAPTPTAYGSVVETRGADPGRDDTDLQQCGRATHLPPVRPQRLHRGTGAAAGDAARRHPEHRGLRRRHRDGRPGRARDLPGRLSRAVALGQPHEVLELVPARGPASRRRRALADRRNHRAGHAKPRRRRRLACGSPGSPPVRRWPRRWRRPIPTCTPRPGSTPAWPTARPTTSARRSPR